MKLTEMPFERAAHKSASTLFKQIGSRDMALAVALLAVDSKDNHPVIPEGINPVAHCQPAVQRLRADHYFRDKTHDSSMV